MKPRRLVDLEVQKVSLVDAPANRRRFLIVKRQNGATTEEHASAPDALRASRDHLRALIQKAKSHRHAHVVGTLDAIVKDAEYAHADLRESLHRIVKGEVQGDQADTEAERAIYDLEDAYGRLADALTVMHDEAERTT